MNRNINGALDQSRFDFFGKQTFAADVRQGAIQIPVAAGRHNNDLDLIFVQMVMCGNQTIPHFMGLGQGQRTATGADTKHNFTFFAVYH